MTLGQTNKTITTLVLVSLLLTTAVSQAQTVEEVLAALGKDRTLGSSSAPVSIVEFSDFQCSFCRKFWGNTFPQLKESYLKDGKVRFTYRHFAILGKFSEQAAMAADCAGEQEKFWEYHDKLFANQGGLAFTQSKLQQCAGELGLKAANFKRCLTTERYRKKVEGETAVAASLGARGTPTFFVNERLMVRAQPFSVFEAVIDEALGKSTKKYKSTSKRPASRADFRGLQEKRQFKSSFDVPPDFLNSRTFVSHTVWASLCG
jgi:protein-disulfide isomerase